MENSQPAYVTAQMLIRKPAATVYEAFVDPAITRNFWFTKGSGKLETGATVTWEWEMYGVSAQVLVKEMIPARRILVEWGDPVTTVDFTFEAMSDDTTYVVIKNSGFTQTGDALIRQVNDSTGGFTTVVDGLKAYLEHGINLNLVADKFPASK